MAVLGAGGEVQERLVGSRSERGGAVIKEVMNIYNGITHEYPEQGVRQILIPGL